MGTDVSAPVLRRVAARRASRPPSSVACALLLALTKLALATLGVARTVRWIEARTAERPTVDTVPADAVTAIARRVAVAGVWYPGRAMCLEQSLVLYYLLRRAGAAPQLRFGFHLYPFAAHAWVEHGGAPINEDPYFLGKLTPFPEWPR